MRKRFVVPLTVLFCIGLAACGSPAGGPQTATITMSNASCKVATGDGMNMFRQGLAVFTVKNAGDATMTVFLAESGSQPVGKVTVAPMRSDEFTVHLDDADTYNLRCGPVAGPVFKPEN